MSELDALLDTLYHPELKEIDPGLDRVLAFLKALGNPHKRLPPVIHVAGTNGKGSLIAYLRGIFEAAGYAAHIYTSPHLVRFNERIAVAGQEIGTAELIAFLKKVQLLAREIPVTFFEATTAAAFLAFVETPADVVLLETGMGGRLDATNVIDTPALTAITPIGLDHCEFLGDTLAKVAAEKAGILKPGVPCVIGRQSPEAMAAIEERAKALGAPLFALGREWDWRREDDKAIYLSGSHEIPFSPALAGRHQYDNAATAIACAQRLPQFNLPEAAVREGIANARWPARLQCLQEGDVEIWLDGGHNPHGAQAIAQWAAEFGDGRKLHLICGMMRRKDVAGFLGPLAKVTAQLHAVTIPDEEDALPAGELVDIATQCGIPATTAESWQEAVKRLPAGARALICGSLYLAGHVLQEIPPSKE